MVCRDQVQGTRLHIFHEITDEILQTMRHYKQLMRYYKQYV